MNKDVLSGAAALCLAFCGCAQAADKLGRLTIDVKVEGAQSWQQSSDYSNSKISEQYRILTTVKSDGSLESVNLKDPKFAQQQMARAADVQQAVREARARSGKPAPRAPVTQQEYVAAQQRIGAEMQKAQAACKGDINCVMQVAQKFSDQMGQVPAPGIAAVAAPSGSEPEEEERFMNFSGYEGCPGETHIRVNNTAEGATADVAGMVPFKQANTADYKGSELNRKMQCLGSNLVYDVKARRIYTDGIGHAAPRGIYRYWDQLHGETLNKDAEVITNSVAWDWVVKNLRIADAAGSASTTLPTEKTPLVGATKEGSRVSGQVKVNLSWKFELL